MQKNDLALRKFPILCVTVFFGFLTIGLPLAVLPEQVQDVLGFGPILVGIVIGLQSFATVCTRQIAGKKADREGPKPAVRLGLIICCLAGLAYVGSSYSIARPELSLAILIAGRLLLGLGESLLITGALIWGIGLVGSASAGQVMSWNGIAMYGALALGAPVGSWLYHSLGFAAAMTMVAVCPLVGFQLTRWIPDVRGENVLEEREPFVKLVQKIGIYGLGMGLGTIGFGALSAFIVLYFNHKGWGNAGTAMLIFGACYISVRVVAGHLPDRTGGRSVAIASLSIEALGQALIWFAPNLTVAYLGTALTGFGFSLVFPAFGVQAAKHVPASSRGSAFGAFFAFFDIALGITGPLCGVIASLAGYSSIYLMGALSCLAGVAIAVSL